MGGRGNRQGSDVLFYFRVDSDPNRASYSSSFSKNSIIIIQEKQDSSTMDKDE